MVQGHVMCAGLGKGESGKHDAKTMDGEIQEVGGRIRERRRRMQDTGEVTILGCTNGR